jgi:nitroreductase
VDEILAAAVSAPDHGRLRPWRFTVIRDEAIDRFSDLLGAAFRHANPDATPEATEREAAKAKRAPLIVVVGAHVEQHPKIPPVEQILAAGAAAQNILLAANALGFGAVWKTGAPAYSDIVKSEFGLTPQDAIVGFIHIGTSPRGRVPSLPRAGTQDAVTVW